MKEIPLEERLIVAADYIPEKKEEDGTITILRGKRGDDAVAGFITEIIGALSGTGVYIKFNSLGRDRGKGIVKKAKKAGLKVCWDMKYEDIGETLAKDGVLVGLYEPPDIVTVMCSAGPESLERLRKALPDTEILGVSVLTNQKEKYIQDTYKMTIPELEVALATPVLDFLDGLVCAPKEVPYLREHLKRDDLTYNCANVRPLTVVIPGDDQNALRGATPTEAIQLGVSRVIMGRAILLQTDKRSAVTKILQELSEAQIGVTHGATA